MNAPKRHTDFLKTFGHKAIAALFLLLLFFPVAVQSAHIFNSHRHEICHDFESHLHETQLDCSVCDFHFSIFDFKPIVVSDSFKEIEFNQEVVFSTSLSSETFPIHFYLRGPPLFS